MMKRHPEEFPSHQEYWADAARREPFPFLTDAQVAKIRREARLIEEFSKSHPRLHNVVGLLTVAFLIGADIAALVYLGPISIFLAAAAHGFLLYGTVVYTMHEGAGHAAIIRSSRAFGKIESAFWRGIARFVHDVVPRLVFADPDYYRTAHPAHHAYLGTEKDGAYSHFVALRRFWISLLPGAGMLPFNDYKIHTDDRPSPSLRRTQILGGIYALLLLALTTHAIGFLPALALVVGLGPWFGFVLDRLRESTEHQLMPASFESGSREFGFGFWGLLLGGGPWGQPCHLSHHLAPSLSWFGQLRLHARIRKILTADQKAVFFITPVVGYPRLLARILVTNWRIQMRRKGYRIAHRMELKFISTKRAYEKALELREACYDSAGKLPPSVIEGETPEYRDPSLRLIGIYDGERLVGSLSLGLPRAGEENPFRFLPRSVQSRPDLCEKIGARPEECLEIGRLCIHPEYRGTDVIKRIFQEVYAELVRSGRSVMLISSDAKLIHKYQVTLFRKTGVSYRKRQRSGTDDLYLLANRQKFGGDYALNVGFWIYPLYLAEPIRQAIRDGFYSPSARARAIYRLYSAFGFFFELLEENFIHRGRRAAGAAPKTAPRKRKRASHRPNLDLGRKNAS